ncbi:putative membrane protein [Propionispora sp. 2/2-37]|uniref:VanZ family protein n=1 Tax=Propionispora sp. 2/2-37 TaxID=1677858 RepID=UPI0006BB8DC8|nr:VanZ family protein [Propionispora sp. 2/2-37]CUH94467.1 putative membrane protein [Propionispora sp. 2/2-37]
MRDLLRWLPALAVMLAIYIFSGIPGLHPISNSWLPRNIQVWIQQYSLQIGEGGFFSYAMSLDPNFILHKAGHILFFGMLGIATFIATRYSFPWGAGLAISYAVLDEFHQSFTAGRTSRLGDILLDSAAILMFIWLFNRRLQKEANDGSLGLKQKKCCNKSCRKRK